MADGLEYQSKLSSFIAAVSKNPMVFHFPSTFGPSSCPNPRVLRLAVGMSPAHPMLRFGAPSESHLRKDINLFPQSERISNGLGLVKIRRPDHADNSYLLGIEIVSPF